MAFEVLAKDIHPAETAAACCLALAQAAGPSALIGGQVDDVAEEQASRRRLEENGRSGEQVRGKEPLGKEPTGEGQFVAGRNEGFPMGSLAALESVHRRKTGAMFLVSLRLGGLTAAADAGQLASLDEYGRRLGLAFQITDDLLDVSGDEKAVGKRVGKDADRGKLTFPGLLGARESRQRAERLAAEACQALAPLGSAAEELSMLARYVVERDR
jgi:geranylgeranyl diphosphate synthase type II